jgi:hypothetical protein
MAATLEQGPNAGYRTRTRAAAATASAARVGAADAGGKIPKSALAGAEAARSPR